MTSFALKIIAIISMFCDHFGDAFIGHFSFLNSIGRIAFPIFAFQISEGFTHTKNMKKYFLRLGIFALVSQIPFSLFVHKFLGSSLFSLNVFFTLFLGLLSMYLYNYIIKLFNNTDENGNQFITKFKTLHLDKILSIVIVLLLAYVAEILNTDYGFWGVIVIFVFYLFRDNKLAMALSFVTLCIIKYGIRVITGSADIVNILLGIFTALAILFISLYNGKQGKKIKYLLYFFYPIHLLLLYLFF